MRPTLNKPSPTTKLTGNISKVVVKQHQYQADGIKLLKETDAEVKYTSPTFSIRTFNE
jgi:hypothetical protein